mgnify:FL=1
MIDIENKIYSPIRTALVNAYDGIYVTSEPTATSAKFPAVSIVQEDNYMSISKLDNSGEEKFATVMFQVDVYSNKASGRKSQCKEIMGVVDTMLYQMNFTRLSLTPVPMANEGYYRLTARYRAETDGTNLYRI